MTEAAIGKRTVLNVLAVISLCHLLNDMLQSLLPALYPMMARQFDLDFTHIGFLTLTYQLTASILQPVVGSVSDRYHQPYSLAAGMAATLTGLLLLSVATNYPLLLVGAALMGIGSSIFHPEASRVARMASGGRHGLAQSLFQVGGNLGTALGPLLAAFLVLPGGQSSIRWASLGAVAGILLLLKIGAWYKARHRLQVARGAGSRGEAAAVPPARARLAMGILFLLIFSKYFYLVSFSSYYIFYLTETFRIGTESAQIHLFIFLGAVAAGTIVGGPVGDRFGRKRVIIGSILGILPFTLALPHLSLFWTSVFTVPIGVVLASAFPAMVVYGQELMPGRVGAVAGLMFGLAFGMGGIGAALLGGLADLKGIGFVYNVCAFLPMLGVAALFLPDTGRRAAIDRRR